MSSAPLISVIIPVYNTEQYVREAIDSALRQSYAPIEIICINDCSTDGSLAILESYGDRIRIVQNEQNGGIGDARNKGLAIARGAYIAFLDSDDIWHDDKLALQMQLLQSHPGHAIVFSAMQCFLSPELPEEIKRIRFCPPSPIPGYVAGTSLIKKEVFDAVGFFDKKWRVGEFIDWLARAQSAGYNTNLMVEQVLLSRRIHNTNTGVTDRSSRSDYIKILKESLDRKRQQQP